MTDTAQRGYYVVYLFRSDGRRVSLSLNQATTEVRKDFPSKYRAVLADRAEYAAHLLAPFWVSAMITGSINLGGVGGLTRGYEAGNIAAVEYRRGLVPGDGELVQDLHRLLSLYATYKAARLGQIEGGEEDLPPDISSADEARKYRWHRRAERNRKLAAAAKAYHGYTCGVCGFNFEERYGVVGHKYIEAHHLTPMSELAAEPEPVVLDPATDFVTVCANCHRMLHRVKPILTPDQLRGRVRG